MRGLSLSNFFLSLPFNLILMMAAFSAWIGFDLYSALAILVGYFAVLLNLIYILTIFYFIFFKNSIQNRFFSPKISIFVIFLLFLLKIVFLVTFLYLFLVILQFNAIFVFIGGFLALFWFIFCIFRFFLGKI